MTQRGRISAPIMFYVLFDLFLNRPLMVSQRVLDLYIPSVIFTTPLCQSTWNGGDIPFQRTSCFCFQDASTYTLAAGCWFKAAYHSL